MVELAITTDSRRRVVLSGIPAPDEMEAVKVSDRRPNGAVISVNRSDYFHVKSGDIIWMGKEGLQFIREIPNIEIVRWENLRPSVLRIRGRGKRYISTFNAHHVNADGPFAAMAFVSARPASAAFLGPMTSIPMVVNVRSLREEDSHD